MKDGENTRLYYCIWGCDIPLMTESEYKEHTKKHDCWPSIALPPVALNQPDQGKRSEIRPRHDLIPIEFLDELASIFEEGRRPRPGLPEGDGDSWKKGGELFLRDCLNHASNHLHLYMNGDRSENHLAKVAWNTLAVLYHAKNKPT